jgi:hypothetical protein
LLVAAVASVVGCGAGRCADSLCPKGSTCATYTSTQKSVESEVSVEGGQARFACDAMTYTVICPCGYDPTPLMNPGNALVPYYCQLCEDACRATLDACSKSSNDEFTSCVGNCPGGSDQAFCMTTCYDSMLESQNSCEHGNITCGSGCSGERMTCS